MLVLILLCFIANVTPCNDKQNINMVMKLNNYYFQIWHLNTILNFLYDFVYLHIMVVMTNLTWMVLSICYEMKFQLIIMINDIKSVICYCEQVDGRRSDHEVAQKYIFERLKAIVMHYNVLNDCKHDFQRFFYYEIIYFNLAAVANAFVTMIYMFFVIIY